jgi:hypothetical protein
VSVSDWPVTHCATFEKVSRLVREAWPDARQRDASPLVDWHVGSDAMLVAVAEYRDPLWRVRIKKGE